MRSFQNDMKFGMKGETAIHSKISQHFSGMGLIRNTKDIYNDPYYRYDYEAADGTSFELKTRRNSKTAYPTTIVPASKIVPDCKNRQFFVFVFTDCCCKIEYNKEIWDKFRVTDVVTYRYGREDRPTPHYHIPISHLLEMC